MSDKRVIVYGTASEQALVRTIEELRRENAALSVQLKHETERSIARLNYACELQFENAALRAENHLLCIKSKINVNQMYGVADATAARKEAQP